MEKEITPARYIRTDILGMTQTQMAECFNVTQATVSRWDTSGIYPVRVQQRIREMAQRRGTWDDKWFFQVPERAA